MTRPLLGCLLSAVLASGLTVWLADGRPAAATAQSVTRPGPPPLTAEEAVRVRVSESANRGVVNVTARTTTGA